MIFVVLVNPSLFACAHNTVHVPCVSTYHVARPVQQSCFSSSPFQGGDMSGNAFVRGGNGGDLMGEASQDPDSLFQGSNHFNMWYDHWGFLLDSLPPVSMFVP